MPFLEHTKVNKSIDGFHSIIVLDVPQHVFWSNEQKLTSSRGDWMFGGGVECFSVYTAAW
jgi:hypothetical protein